MIPVLLIVMLFTVTPEQERELARIATLGYITGNSSFSGGSGVVAHDPDLAYQGYTLYTRSMEQAAHLIDMDGEVVHSWSGGRGHTWTRVRVFENGDLLVLSREGTDEGLFMIDKHSLLKWVFPDRVHHDAIVVKDTIYAIGARGRELPRIFPSGPVRDDLILTLSMEGKLLSSVSVYDCFANSPEHSRFFIENPPQNRLDFLHTNSIELIPDDAPVPDVLRGCAMISMRTVSTIAVIDMKREEVVWTLSGPFRMQHEARLVGGNILLFDNMGLPEQSTVMEIDPETQEIVWSYTEDGFYSEGRGAQQRLPNGNTLIVESDSGRLIEVTRGGDIVWEYRNPKARLINPSVRMGIMRAERLPPDYPIDWANGGICH